MEKTANIRDFFGVWMRRAFEPITRILQRLHVTPNQITVAGTLLNVAAAVLVAMDRYIVAGIVFLVAGCFDMLDGALARSANKVTPFGAFFDSTLDRFSEGVMLAAIACARAAMASADCFTVGAAMSVKIISAAETSSWNVISLLMLLV